MVKKIVQDINIKKPKLLKFEESNTVHIPEMSNTEKKFSQITQFKRSRRYLSSTPTLKKKKFLPSWVLLVLILGIIVSLVYISYAFLQKAHITINTKKQNFSFNEELFTAYKQDEKKPRFEIMILNDTYNKKITFSDPKQVSIKAHGIVFLKNEYSSKPQKVLINTKIMDDYGKLYTTDSTVTIPGFTKLKDKINPGSIAVKVTAVSPGDEYNTDSKNFLIPSFEKTDKYTKIYGVAINPITGGALGNLYSLGPVEIGTINAEANTVFKDQIMRKLGAQIPEGYILYPGATNFSYYFNEDTKSKELSGNVEVIGTINAAIFKKDDLANAFIRKATKNIKDSEYEEISIEDMSKFTLKLSEKSKLITKDMNEVSFTVNGGSILNWNPDIDILRQSILGINVLDLSNIAKKDPGILDAKVEFSLPFQKTIPREIHRVDIKSY